MLPSGAGAGPRRRRRSRFDPAQRHRGPAGRRARRAGARARARPAVGHRRPRSSASRSTARTTCAPARLGADARGPHPGRLRPRPGAAPDRRRCAARCARATPAARWSTAHGRVVATIFAATTQRPARRLRRPNDDRARRRSRGRGVAAPVVDGSLLAADRHRRYPAPTHGQDARHRREAVRRPRPHARAAGRVRRSTRATSSRTRTSSRGRSATSSSSPSRTSTTPSTRSGGWPTCRSCPTSSSSSCATSARRSR